MSPSTAFAPLVDSDNQYVDPCQPFPGSVKQLRSISGTQTAPICETTFLKRWQEAQIRNQEANWSQLPEDIFDLLEQHDEQLSANDTQFLATQIAQSSTSTVAVISAIRLLGILAEESLVPRNQALAILRDSLFHPNANCRYYAVKALWQANDKRALASLERIVERDSAEQVRELATRAIAALA